jgi:signal transduction histidine kinase
MKPLRLTIRQRLTLVITCSTLLVLSLVGYFIYCYSVRFCEREFRRRIEERLALADSVIGRDRLHPFTMISEIPPGYLPDEKIIYYTDPNQITAPNGYEALPQLIDTTQFHRCKMCFAHIGQRDYGILHDSLSHHTLVISAVDRYGQTKIENLRINIILGILLGVLLLALIGWFWIKYMLKPIADNIKKARAIGAKSLNLRLDVKNEYDELGQLALTFNAMLERIEQGFHAQQQFIRNASHEMRTPLTAIHAETELALQQSRDSAFYRQSLESIGQRSKSLSHLVSQLLTMTKIDAGNNIQNEQICAADEILLLAIKDLQIKYPDAGQHIQLQIEASNAAELQIRCDPALLQTAFFNLLDNAVKYGESQIVRVRLLSSDESICIEVADQGQGIAQEDMAHLFKPFYRGRSSRHLQGSGVGLSLVKSIADKYGGNVTVASRQNEGTTVFLRLLKNLIPF